MRRAAAAALLLALGSAAGCGTDDPAPVPDGPPVTELRIGMQEYRYQLSAGALLPGTVTVVVTNAGSAPHDVVLRQEDREIGRSDVLGPGDRQTLEVTVDPAGPVHLECTLTGHSAAGMHTSLAVAGADGVAG